MITCISFSNAQNGALSKVGQIVLVCNNPLVPLSQWELDWITACQPVDDELIRVVIVKTDRSKYRQL